MSRLNTIAHAAQRRRRLRRVLRSMGSALCWASAIEIALVLVDRAMGLGLGWIALAAPPAGLVLIITLRSALRRDPLIGAAHELDLTLGLSDRLASGVAFGSVPDRGAFEELALTDAERTAQRVRAARGIRLDTARTHRWWPWAAALAIALAVWLPARAPRGSGAAPLASTTAERDEARDDISQATEHLRDTLEARPELFEEATTRQLEALEALQDELGRPGADAAETRAKAAQTLAQTADALRDEAQQTRRALDATAQSVAPGSGDPIAEALRRGDFDDAADQLEAMRDGARSDADRRATAERLDRLADLISAPTPPDDGVNADARTLAEQGVDPDRAQRLAEEGDADAIGDELRSLGQDPIDAESIADTVRDHAREREAQRQAAERARDMSEALRDAAEEARDHEDTPPDEPGADQDQPQDADQSGGETQPGEPRGGASQNQDPGQASPDSPAGSSDDPPPGEGEPSQGQRGTGGEPSRAPAPGEGEPSGLGRAERLARDLSQDRERESELRSAADEIDRSAGRTAPQGSPGPVAGTSPSPPGDGRVTPQRTEPRAPNTNLMTDPVDARPRTDSTRALAEVEALGPALPGRGFTPAAAQQALREAAPGAERAIENQGVPARFRDLVRRYFRPAAHAPPPAPAPPQDGS